MTAANIDVQISRLHTLLYTFTKRFTTDHDESLDLVQDTILKALTYSDKFRENTNLKGWLFTIMRNTFINNYRKGRRSKVLHDYTKELHYLSSQPGESDSAPASTVEYDDIWKHINALPGDLLVPFRMYILGYKYHEIAVHQRIPIGTVKSKIFHARKELKKVLTEH